MRWDNARDRIITLIKNIYSANILFDNSYHFLNLYHNPHITSTLPNTKPLHYSCQKFDLFTHETPSYNILNYQRRSTRFPKSGSILAHPIKNPWTCIPSPSRSKMTGGKNNAVMPFAGGANSRLFENFSLDQKHQYPLKTTNSQNLTMEAGKTSNSGHRTSKWKNQSQQRVHNTTPHKIGQKR